MHVELRGNGPIKSRAQNRIAAIVREIDEYYGDSKITSDLIELRNIALVAALTVQSPLFRREGRGLHTIFNIRREMTNTGAKTPFFEGLS